MMMTKRNTLSVMTAAVMFMSASMVWAHDVTHRGTVVAVEAARLQVKTVDAKTKKEDTQWYNVGPKTRTKRGDKVLPYLDANIAAGELVVLLVNHGGEAKMLITEIRLAVK